VPNERKILNEELKNKNVEWIVTYFKALYWHSSGETGEIFNHDRRVKVDISKRDLPNTNHERYPPDPNIRHNTKVN
jgi:hypothetical protein